MAAKEEELEQKAEALDVLAGDEAKLTETSRVYAMELEAVQNKLGEATEDLKKHAAEVTAKEETIQKGYAVVRELEDKLDAAEDAEEVLTAALAAERHQLERAREEQGEVLERLTAAETDLAQQRLKVEKMQAAEEANLVHSDLEAIKLEAIKNELKAKEATEEAKESAMTEQRQALDEALSRLSAAEKDLTKGRLEVEELRSEGSELANKLKGMIELEAQLEQAKARGRRLEGEVESLRTEGVAADRDGETIRSLEATVTELKRQLEEQTEALARLASNEAKLDEANRVHATELEVVESELEKAVEELKSTTANMAAKEEELKQKTEALDVLAGNEDKLTEASRVHATELEVVQNELEQAGKELKSATANISAKEEELKQKTEALDVLAGNADKFTKASQVHATELEAVQNKLREAIADLENQAALVIAKEETIQKGYVVVGELEDKLEAAKESTEAGLTSQRRQQAAEVAELETKAAAEAELARRLEGRLEAAAELAGQLEQARGEAGELREEVYKLKFDVAEAEKQRDMVDEECDKLEEKFKNKADQVVTLEKEKEKIKKHLLEQKEYSDKMFEINQRLKLPVDKFEAEGVRAKTKETMEAELERVKEELGKKNIEFASLKVDVEKDELVFKKKCNVLQSDLDYEKATNTRLTQQIRRFQSNEMETTVVAPRATAGKTAAASAGTNTSALPDSPVWSSGSGVIKEMLLHDAQTKVRSLENENKTRKEHEEFYIEKAREWKSRALKYERVLERNKIPVPGKENKPEAAALQDPAKEVATAPLHEQKTNEGRSNLQRLTSFNAAADKGDSTVVPTEDMQLVLNRGPVSRRTEKDFFKLPAAKSANPDDCKTQ